MANLYDDLIVDIEKEHERINEDRNYRSKTEHYLGMFGLLLFVTGIYQKMVDSGLIRGWFTDFSEYWTRALGARPLKLHDFFYLYCDYRKKFQRVEVNENANETEFMGAWQRPENIYLTFGSVYQYALRPFSALPYLKYLPKGSRILEYGCGLAPITTSLIRWGKKYDFSVADIRTFTFHYAKYRLKQHKVRFIDLVPYKNNSFEGQFDAVFLMAVLEHLPNPLEVLESLTNHIERGGYLIFNYILGSGHGLDNKEAVHQRKEVLDYIASNFKIVKGNLFPDKSMGLTVGCKK
jgi:2-polyprenyl-3-methyl-5-hydroxy-6-metoxy-1,4-benzoquinol methylase